MITVVVALLSVLCIVIGVTSVLFLRSFLIDRLDSDLMAATHAPPNDRGRGGGTEGGGPLSGGAPPPGVGPPPCTASAATLTPLQFPGLPWGSVAARMVNGQLVGGSQLTSDNCQQPLTTDQLAAMDPGNVLNTAYTRQVGSLGTYRMYAAVDSFGNVAIYGVSLSTVTDPADAFGFIVASVGAAALIVATVVGTAIVRRTLRPLRRVADTASRVAELELGRGDVALSVRVPESDTDPHTEVGQVGAALNRMLGHVDAALAARQASEMRVRQFVADASHELRTPLAAIRGYAELTRRSDDDVPPNVAHAIRRVESESARMTVLVNDLLLLARLDSGRPLARDQVDLSRLVVDTVSDAHIAGPRHNWRLDLPPDPVVVSGDEQRLHQVLANLLSNARTHTPAGATVTTGLAESNGDVVLTVADDGPGIPSDLLPEVFERFARADTSRSRNSGSTGLGLAIVAAVVAAHDGAVDVVSEPGNTVFTVRLPHHSSNTGAAQE
ncbi:MAG TPA: ATP-binding protein [Pseudonocardiaceae bacterium]|nr:ATP-binding protein [Pseudonocardiaceae bacterium]